MPPAFDADRLGRVGELVDRYVSEGRFAGAQVQVAHRGEVAYRHTVGVADVATQQPLAEDAVYRIYSMTKPITSIALMQLYERGLFLLEDPVEKFIPEFAARQVLVGGSLTKPRTRPAQTVMNVRHLLTHTSGLTYGFLYQNNLDAMYRQLAVGEFELADATLADVVERIAGLPLLFDPGSAWNYSVSTDVCGRLVEIMAGTDLDDYIAEHITEPLKMRDAGFFVRPEAVTRFTSNHAVLDDDPLACIDTAVDSPYLTRPTFLSGGGGMVATLDDYQRFVDMLVLGGRLDGEQIIGRKTLEFMGRNHLPNGATLNQMGQSSFSEAAMEGTGFGLGFSVIVDPAANGATTSAGEMAWGGAASTGFWVDPVEEITCVFMTQLMPSSTYPIRRELRATVYQALR